MTINNLFNETDLYIFCRQNNFAFNEFHLSADGTVLAVDKESGKLFVGRELTRNKVHDLSSILSADLEDGGTVVVSFKDLSAVCFVPDKEDAAGIVSELKEAVRGTVMDADGEEKEAGVETADGGEVNEYDEEKENGECGEDVVDGDYQVDLAETYSRLINTGRSQAIGYLVSETGMSVEDACRYVDELDPRETDADEAGDEAEDGGASYYQVPDYNNDGTMTREGVLRVVKSLRHGDGIHLEYEPLLGRVRVFDTNFVRLRVDMNMSRYFSMSASGDDYESLKEDIAADLFEYIEIVFLHPDNLSETSCHLKRVTMLARTIA